MQRLARLKTNLARWGLMKTVWAAIMVRLKPWVMLSQVHIRKNQQEHKAPTHDGITIRLADYAELVRASESMPDQISLAFIQSSLSRGDICAGAFADTTMVGFQWASFTTAMVNDELWVKFNEPYRYGYKGYTRPEYRGRRLIQSVLRCADRECLARGRTHTISYIETHNYPSLKHNKQRMGNQGAAAVTNMRRRVRGPAASQVHPALRI
jgi:hypothetical protein